MAARSLRLSALPRRATRVSTRAFASAPAPGTPTPEPGSSSLPQNTNPAPSPNPAREQTWLARKIKESPAAKSAFLNLVGFLGYGSAKQYAGRRAFAMYAQLCVPRPDEDEAFWREVCHLPPTFQSWFTIVNLHVWLLTVRLRALPPPHGTHHIQGLLDHFFIDVEDRVRAVLQPSSSLHPSAPSSSEPALSPAYGGAEPYTRRTAFYTVANAQPSFIDPAAPAKKRPKGNAPERLVSRQMRILREQWAGMGMALDLGLVRSDAELAAAVWRNFLGARGARGIAFPHADGARGPAFRRTVNLVGGKVERVPEALDAEETRDDGSGVFDHPPAEFDKYARYPETMAALVAYVRRELVRLEALEDAVVMGGRGVGHEARGVDALRFGRVDERSR